VINVRRITTIMGIFLIFTILISSQVIAASFWIEGIDSSTDCTNPEEAIDEPDDTYATIGANPSKLGIIILDFGVYAAMGPSETFTVYGTRGTGLTETYNVSVWNPSKTDHRQIGSGEDTKYEDFTAPSDSGMTWQFVQIDATWGSTIGNDTIFGPEIDAVGYHD
jgi:hypothetical protein